MVSKLEQESRIVESKTKDVEIEQMKCETGKHDYESILKSPKINSEYYKK